MDRLDLVLWIDLAKGLYQYIIYCTTSIMYNLYYIIIFILYMCVCVCARVCVCVCAIKYSNDKMIMYCTTSIMHVCYIIIFIVIIMYVCHKILVNSE